MEPLDDDELFGDQEYIPSLWEADKLGRSAPGHNDGIGIHAGGLTPQERKRNENERKRRSKARAQTP
eukprot:11453411-Prorocentrum_lima.AAC.1